MQHISIIQEYKRNKTVDTSSQYKENANNDIVIIQIVHLSNDLFRIVEFLRNGRQNKSRVKSVIVVGNIKLVVSIDWIFRYYTWKRSECIHVSRKCDPFHYFPSATVIIFRQWDFHISRHKMGNRVMCSYFTLYFFILVT